MVALELVRQLSQVEGGESVIALELARQLLQVVDKLGPVGGGRATGPEQAAVASTARLAGVGIPASSVVAVRSVGAVYNVSVIPVRCVVAVDIGVVAVLGAGAVAVSVVAAGVVAVGTVGGALTLALSE